MENQSAITDLLIPEGHLDGTFDNLRLEKFTVVAKSYDEYDDDEEEITLPAPTRLTDLVRAHPELKNVSAVYEFTLLGEYSNCYTSPELIKALCQLPSLEKLFIRLNSLITIDISDLRRCAAKEVEIKYLADRYEPTVADILRMKNIQKLTTNKFNFNTETSQTLRHFKSDAIIAFNLNKILGNFEALERLELTKNPTSTSSWTFVEDDLIYPHLKVLRMEQNLFLGDLNKLLEALPCLENLYIGANNIHYSTTYIEKLSLMPKLREVEIGFDIFTPEVLLTATAVKLLKTLCRKLKKFSMGFIKSSEYLRTALRAEFESEYDVKVLYEFPQRTILSNH